MERLDFSTLWLNKKWSDITLVIKPRGGPSAIDAAECAGPGPSSTTMGRNAGRRVTRSMMRGSPAIGAGQTNKSSPTLNSAATQRPARTHEAGRRDVGRGGTVQASRGLSEPATSNPIPAGVPAPGPFVGQSAKCDLATGSVVIPAHAAVLISTSEYFKRYFDSWHPDDSSKVVTIEVEPEEVGAAKMMLRYMYTGQLPPQQEIEPCELLRMVKLADQFSVTRFLASCNSALADMPLDRLTLDHVTTILALPPFLLEGGALAVARRRAEDKLVQLFGDLEGAWFDPVRRQEFLRLPLSAVKHLLSRTETAVYNENTALVALTDWIAFNSGRGRAADGQRGAAAPGTSAPVSAGVAAAEAGPVAGAGHDAALAASTLPPPSSAQNPQVAGRSGGHAATGPDSAAAGGPSAADPAATDTGAAAGSGAGPPCTALVLLPNPGPAPAADELTEAQLDELFGLIRLSHLSSAFMSLLPHISWVRRRLTPQLLAGVLQLVKAEMAAAGGGVAGGAGGGAHRTAGDGSGRPLAGLYGGSGALELLQRLNAPTSIPRAVPERSALELEWTINRSDIQALIAECRAEECHPCPRASGEGGDRAGGSGGASGGGDDSGSSTVESTRLFSEPAYYYAGFYWRMCFFVQKKVEPKRRRLGDLTDATAGGAGAGPGHVADGGAGGGGGPVDAGDGGGAGGAGGGGGGPRSSGSRPCSSSSEVAVYHDFLGITCRAVLGGEEFAPLTSMNLELMAARFNALGEQLPAQRAEVPGYIDDEVPYGVYDFFRQDNLSDASQLAPFMCRRDMLHLSCKITRCS